MFIVCCWMRVFLIVLVRMMVIVGGVRICCRCVFLVFLMLGKSFGNGFVSCCESLWWMW